MRKNRKIQTQNLLDSKNLQQSALVRQFDWFKLVYGWNQKIPANNLENRAKRRKQLAAQPRH
jgi:hypothetical protein